MISIKLVPSSYEYTDRIMIVMITELILILAFVR
jgi:hypothetical protein